MNILAFETAADPGSVALLASGKKRIAFCPLPEAASQGLNPSAGTNSQTILPLTEKLLVEADLGFEDINAIAFGQGPGSFTGLRIACGLAQGLAFGRNLPILGISTLAGMADAVFANTGEAHVLSVLDARMGEVYFGFFEEGLLQGEIQVGSPDVIPIPKSPHWAMAGNALTAYPSLQARAAHLPQYPEVLPSAMGILNLALPRFLQGECDSFEKAQPFYVRNKVAQTTAERAQEKAR